MIVGSVRATQLEWLEPDDGDVIERHPAPSPAPAPPASAPASAAPSARPGEAAPASLLDTLPPAGVQPPPSAPPSTAAAANSTPVSSYVGERPVDPTWLAARETALVAVRADYEAARARAQANGGTGPGWTPAVLVTDESGQTHSASGAPLLHVTDPNAAPVQVGWDEGGPVYQPDPGTWLEFDEAAFAAAYRAQGGAPLQALAAQYGTNAATLLAQHPDLWAVATTDHALNAGPAPAGVAMGNASQLGMLDLYLADPQIASLVQTYGGTVAPATGGIAQEQVRLYGHARYEQLSRLGNAMQSVRDQYVAALANAAAGGSSAGWTEQEVAVYATDESGQQIGGPTGTTTVRSFDPDAFTAWYVTQDGQANRAFGDFYGLSTTTHSTDESGQVIGTSIVFTNPNWSMAGIGGAMTHSQLVAINPNDPPELNNDQAVGFDLEVGWATSPSNIHEDTDWFEIVVKVAIVAAISYFSAGTLGPEVAGAMGMTTTVAETGAVVLTTGGVIVSAGVAGAAASIASGVMNDNLTFKGVLQGALAGALTAGLMQGVNAAIGTSTVGTIAARTTIQGGIQALLGGKFADGAIAGFASGLADAVGAGMNANIDKMSPTEAMAARTLARVFTSAVRALGNPNDPSYGFASALVSDLVNDGLDAATQGGAAPQTPPAPGGSGATPDAPPATQATHPPPSDPFLTISDVDDRTLAEQIADQVGVPRDEIVDAGLLDEARRSGEVMLGFLEGAGFSILSVAEALAEVARSPMQFANGVKALLSSPQARAQFTEEFITRMRVDVQMLEDAFNAGDLRGTGQQLGKLTTDLAQVAGGVEAIARLGVSTASAGGRAILGAMDTLADAALAKIPSLFDAAGNALMDFRALTTAQKQVIGETMGAQAVERLVPDAQRIGRVPTIGQRGIDDLFKVIRPDVDYVVVEYKFGSSQLKGTADGLQMSDTWLQGSVSGANRVLESVGGAQVVADDVTLAIARGRIERWLVHTDPLGNVTVGMVDSSGRFIPQPVSRLLGAKP